MDQKNILNEYNKPSDKNIPRRQFVKNIALVGAALSLPTVIPAKAFGANDRVNVAVQGVNGHGKNHIDGYMNLDNVQVTTLVDPDHITSGKTGRWSRLPQNMTGLSSMVSS